MIADETRFIVNGNGGEVAEAVAVVAIVGTPLVTRMIS